MEGAKGMTVGEALKLTLTEADIVRLLPHAISEMQAELAPFRDPPTRRNEILCLIASSARATAFSRRK
jgi:hypothetical protein